MLEQNKSVQSLGFAFFVEHADVFTLRLKVLTSLEGRRGGRGRVGVSY